MKQVAAAIQKKVEEGGKLSAGDILRVKRAIDNKARELQKQNGGEKKKEYLPHNPKKGLDLTLKNNEIWKFGGLLPNGALRMVKQTQQYRNIPYKYGKHTGGFTMSNFAWSASQHKKMRTQIKKAYELAKPNNDFWLAATFDFKESAAFGEPEENYKRINDEMNNVMHILRASLCPDAILVLESHANGLPHFHAAFGISAARSKLKTYDTTTIEGVIFYIETVLAKETDLELTYAEEMKGEAWIEYLQKQFKYDIDKLDSVQKKNNGVLPQELINYFQGWIWASKAGIRRVRVPRITGNTKTSATKTQKLPTPHGIVLMPKEEGLTEQELLKERTELINAFKPCLANIENGHCDACRWGMWIRDVVFPYKTGAEWIPYKEYTEICALQLPMKRTEEGYYDLDEEALERENGLQSDENSFNIF